MLFPNQIKKKNRLSLFCDFLVEGCYHTALDAIFQKNTSISDSVFKWNYLVAATFTLLRLLQFGIHICLCSPESDFCLSTPPCFMGKVQAAQLETHDLNHVSFRVKLKAPSLNLSSSPPSSLDPITQFMTWAFQFLDISISQRDPSFFFLGEKWETFWNLAMLL